MKTNKIKKIFEHLVIMTIIILLILLTIMITERNLHNHFEEACNSNNGIYFETQNVTCDARYPYCYKNCEINGKNYNYYDMDMGWGILSWEDLK